MSEEEILESVADALLTLANVGYGDYSTRLSISADDTSPLANLYGGINEMISSLAVEQERSKAYQAELEEKLATIEKQRAAIRELSTPIMEVWEGVLCLPIVGVMDTVRSAEMTSELLHAITLKRTRSVIIDLTGIEVMDTHTVDHFMRMARAIRILGASCALTGINPHIAQTIVQMGLDFSDLVSHRTMADALQQFLADG